MVTLIRTLISLFWVLDVCNMPFMEIFDTQYPLNDLFWFLVLMFVYPSVSSNDDIKER